MDGCAPANLRAGRILSMVLCSIDRGTGLTENMLGPHDSIVLAPKQFSVPGPSLGSSLPHGPRPYFFSFTVGPGTGQGMTAHSWPLPKKRKAGHVVSCHLPREGYGSESKGHDLSFRPGLMTHILSLAPIFSCILALQ